MSFIPLYPYSSLISYSDLVDTEHDEGNVYKMLLGSFVQAFDNQNAQLQNDDGAATIRPTSSSTYLGRRQPTIDSTYDAPPSMGSYVPTSLTYRPSPSREPNRRETNPGPQRESIQHESRHTREDQQRFTGTSFHAQPQPRHHQSSASHNSFYDP